MSTPHPLPPAPLGEPALARRSKKTTMHLSLDPEAIAAAGRLAARERRSVSSLIEWLIMAAVAKDQP